MWSSSDQRTDRIPTTKRHGASGHRIRISRLLVRFLQRNSARIAITVLLLQIVYIFFKLDIKVVHRGNVNGRTIGGDVDYVYNYAYQDKVVPRHPDQFARRKNKNEQIEVVQGRNDLAKAAARIPVVVYDEDYDHLDGDEDHVAKPAKEVKHEIPDIPEKEQAEVPVNMVPLQKVTPAPKPETPKPPNPTLRVCTMTERLRHLMKYCNSTDTGDKRPDYFRRSRYGSLLVDEKHKIVFCDVSQAASVLFSTVIAKATGTVKLDRPPVRSRKYMNKIGLKYLDSYTDIQRDDILKGYFKFMAVQHPFDRLVQTWRSKLVETSPNDSWRRKLGHQIILAHRKVNNKPILEENISPQETAWFEEFTEFAFVDRNMVDPSWFTYLQVCHPCEIEYDAVVRTETLAHDADDILSQMKDYRDGIPSDVIKVPTDVDLVHGITHLKQFQNVSVVGHQKLFAKFEHDFGLFGYKWDSKQNRADCNINTGKDGLCC